MLKKKLKRYGLIFGIVAVGIVGAGLLQGRSVAKQSTAPAPVVKTELSKEAEKTVALEISGFVRGADRADVAPMASGRVLKILKKEGESVRRGETVALIDSQQADAQTNSAGASVEALKKMLDDSEKYYDQLVDQAQTARDEAGSTDSADEAVKSAKRARDLQLQAVRSQIAAAQGAFNVAQSGRNNFNVTSPFSGTVTAVHVREGGIAGFSSPLISIASSDSLEIETYVSAAWGRDIAIGTVATFFAPDGAPVSGTVSAVSSGSDIRTLKTLIRIRFDDQAGTLRLGDFVHGEVFVPRASQAVSIPKSAVVSRGGDAVIFIVDGNGVAYERTIKISGEHNGWMDVMQGVDAGENVVVEGQQFLISGINVNIYDAK